MKSLTLAERWRLVQTLRLDSKATPLRRTWIPKRGSAEKRPLGIPTQHDRARQTLVRQALEPEWEAKLSPHTYTAPGKFEAERFPSMAQEWPLTLLPWSVVLPRTLWILLYGFRPGRSCWDVKEAIFNWMKARPQYALKVDIQKCFDQIDHDALLAKTQAPPDIRRQLKAWLKAGIMEEGQLCPTTAGTPQGGTGARRSA